MPRLTAEPELRLEPTSRRNRTAATAGRTARRAAPRPPIRRKPRKRWLLLTMRWSLPALALAATLGGAGWLWQSGWIDRRIDGVGNVALALANRAGLTVEEVLVEGRGRTAAEPLLAAVGVHRGQSILALDPEAIRARVEALPWIASAAVERRLPRTLRLRVTEHEPMALWQRQGKLTLISRTGEAIPEPDIDRFGGLLIVVGDEAPSHTAALIDLLAREPELGRRVTAAVRVAGRRWNLRLDNRIDVRLPEVGSAEAWRELARLEREHGLLQRDLLAVDLQMPDRIVVRLTPAAAVRHRSPSDNT